MSPHAIGRTRTHFFLLQLSYRQENLLEALATFFVLLRASSTQAGQTLTEPLLGGWAPTGRGGCS